MNNNCYLTYCLRMCLFNLIICSRNTFNNSLLLITKSALDVCNGYALYSELDIVIFDYISMI